MTSSVEEEIDFPKEEEEDTNNNTPPKPGKTQKSGENNMSYMCIPNKWGRLLSLHPGLPHVDLISGNHYFLILFSITSYPKLYLNILTLYVTHITIFVFFPRIKFFLLIISQITYQKCLPLFLD